MMTKYYSCWFNLIGYNTKNNFVYLNWTFSHDYMIKCVLYRGINIATWKSEQYFRVLQNINKFYAIIKVSLNIIKRKCKNILGNKKR